MLFRVSVARKACVVPDSFVPEEEGGDHTALSSAVSMVMWCGERAKTTGANDEVHSFKFNPYFPNLLVRVTLAIIYCL